MLEKCLIFYFQLCYKILFVICLHFDFLIHINEHNAIICDVIIVINSRNILRTFLGWQSLMRNYLVMHVSLN
jgi:hypothetical protein